MDGIQMMFSWTTMSFVQKLSFNEVISYWIKQVLGEPVAKPLGCGALEPRICVIGIYLCYALAPITRMGFQTMELSINDHYTWKQTKPGRWERDIDEVEQFYTTLTRRFQGTGRTFFAITAHVSICFASLSNLSILSMPYEKPGCDSDTTTQLSHHGSKKIASRKSARRFIKPSLTQKMTRTLLG